MKRTITLFLIFLFITIAGGIVGSIITYRFLNFSLTPYSSIDERQKMMLTNYSTDTSYRVPKEMDFLSTSKKIVSGVVHIRTSFGPGKFSLNPLEMYYKEPARASGSGVIISDDGYIVTNNHVIEDASNIEVVLNNNQRYYAKVMGTDPSTDLALLKIKARDLPFVKYGNSDNINTGEWVLAIGNPFELNSTVTAGIVSAKARNIGIATSTGSYSGYSFAIPVSLVRKVMDDLLEYGQVQRGMLGVQISDVDAYVAERFSLPVNRGVLITRVNRGSAAEESGIRQGDVITAIDEREVNSMSELQEWVARNRPGKEIMVTFIRGVEKLQVKSRLKNERGREDLTERKIVSEWNGATFEDVQYGELLRLKLDGGVLLKSLEKGNWKDAGLKEGFIIVYLDKVPVDNLADLNRIMEYKRGGVLVEGVYLTGDKAVYGLDW